jgi:hypothetical protein
MHSAIIHASPAFWFMIRAGFLLIVLLGLGAATALSRVISRARRAQPRRRTPAREAALAPRHGIRLH